MNCGQVCMYNTLRGCTVDEYGGKCPLFNTGDKEHKSMTNADRIRAMTDKELAAELTGRFVRFKTDEAAMNGKYLTATELSVARDTYYFVLLRWLQQPCGGADHEA